MKRMLELVPYALTSLLVSALLAGFAVHALGWRYSDIMGLLVDPMDVWNSFLAFLLMGVAVSPAIAVAMLVLWSSFHGRMKVLRRRRHLAAAQSN